LARPSIRLDQLAQQAKAFHQQTTLQRQIAASDAEIDQLVYELYGLTDDEIRIVEQSPTAVAK
jgi:hypothetical protein